MKMSAMLSLIVTVDELVTRSVDTARVDVTHNSFESVPPFVFAVNRPPNRVLDRSHNNTYLDIFSAHKRRTPLMPIPEAL